MKMEEKKKQPKDKVFSCPAGKVKNPSGSHKCKGVGNRGKL